MKGEVVITLENLGSRWVVFARWTYLSQEDEARQFVTAALGEAPTIEGAKTIAGLFGAATTTAVYHMAKDADKLREVQSGVYHAAGMADTLEIEGAISRAGYDARRSRQNLERLTWPTGGCIVCRGVGCSNCRSQRCPYCGNQGPHYCPGPAKDEAQDCIYCGNDPEYRERCTGCGGSGKEAE